MPWENTRNLASTLACNGEMVRFFRRERGWTQHELATVAGYTERLVRKAEAGQTLNADTIEDLAEALSTPACVVHPEDSSDPQAALWTYIDGFALHERQLVARAQSALAENVQIVCPGNPNFLPFAGTYDGRDDFERWPKAFFAMFERPKKLEFLKGHLLVEGKRAAFFSRDSVRLRGTSGPEWHNPLVWVMELDRGKIVRVDSAFDTQAGMNFVRQNGPAVLPPRVAASLRDAIS